MSNDRVVCLVCVHQTNGFCALKKSSVKLNKRRICDNFEQDMSKVRVKVKIPTVKRPDWFWSREERRKLQKAELKKLQEQFEKQEQLKKELKENKGIQMVNPMQSTKYPLTGDLSCFQSTALKEK